MKNVKDKVLAGVSAALILSGVIGLHYDWTMWVIVIPFVWIILGCLLDYIINGKESTRRTGIVAILCALILINMATLLIHHDTPFVVGRLLAVSGCVVLIIDTSNGRING